VQLFVADDFFFGDAKIQLISYNPIPWLVVFESICEKTEAGKD
jgi:hypothetical protein